MFMATKKQSYLEKFEAEAVKILTSNKTHFDEKRIRLNQHFKKNPSIGNNQRSNLEEFYFGNYKDSLIESITEHFTLDRYFDEDDKIKFINFVGSGFLDPKFNNIKKKLKAFELYKKSFERDKISKKAIEDFFENFHLYAKARTMKRRIIYHAGPTNSGKTWGAMQDLIKSSNGCYLAPLRLLAWEKYEELTPHHISALITGEEANRPEGYTHSASTIEMANFQKKYEVAVIDEIQMIGDCQRGWAWTKALINIQANTVYLCGDASAIDLVRKITEMCGDELEIVNHERKSTLTLLPQMLNETDVERGDAVVVFSRKEALLQKINFENMGLKVSIIYGMMTPEVRKEQAKLFLDGKTDIVVSTDAIGMGLNLPIKRVIFATIVKYFDKQEHVITASEIKQIAGRAGRFGLYPEGFVGLLDQKLNSKWNFKKWQEKDDVKKEIASDNHFMHTRISTALGQTLAPLKTATVGPDYDTLEGLNTELINAHHEAMSVLEFLYVFKKIKTNELFTKADIKDLTEQAEMIHYDLPNGVKTDLNYFSDIFKFVVAPVMLKQADHVSEFQRLYGNFFEGVDSDVHSGNTIGSLSDWELSLKCIEIYQWLSNQFDDKFPTKDEEIMKIKKVLIEKINDFLIKV